MFKFLANLLKAIVILYFSTQNSFVLFEYKCTCIHKVMTTERAPHLYRLLFLDKPKQKEGLGPL